MAIARFGSLALLVALGNLPASAFAWEAKVDRWVLERTERPGETAEFLVVLSSQADLAAADLLRDKPSRGRWVVERLQEHAERSQASLLERLTRLGLSHRPFWISNMVLVEGDRGAVQELAARGDVARISANPAVEFDRPRPSDVLEARAGRGIEESLDHVGVPQVFWSRGFTGQGVVIGGQDTGYEWNHPALRASYRGAQGRQVDHNYNWHDAIHSSSGPCGSDSPQPCDDTDHGTHTMGTMVGDDGGANQIGVAPGAQWIGCRNMDSGVGTPASYSECFEWFLAPTDLQGRNPDPSKAPDIINNSWSCPRSEGCTDPNVLQQVVQNTRQAGILVVVSAGNEGPGCETISTPAAIYDASFTVGATTLTDTPTGFTSRGPVTVDGSGRMKPDVVAPGSQIRSSVPGGDYRSLNGTSMAAPHVAGLAALVLSAGECLRGNVAALEREIVAAAQPYVSSESCGGGGNRVPNPVFGAGAIRAAIPSCGGGLSGELNGLEGKKMVCRNRSSRPRQKGSSQLDGASEWSCNGAGVTAGSNDKVKVQLTTSVVESGLASGTIEGIAEPKVVCKNQTAGGKRTVRPEDGEAWDCAAAGLTADAGDRIKVTISGRAS